MGKRKNKTVSVETHHNKTDVKKIAKVSPALVASDALFRNSKSSSFVNFCNENCAKICDEKNIEIYKEFAKQGEKCF